MKSKISLVFFMLAAFILSACNTASPQTTGDWEKHDFQDLGVGFELPSTWTASANENLISIAIGEEAPENSTTPIAGASITMVTASDFDGNSNPKDILGFFMEYFESGQDNLEITSGPRTTTIQNSPAATVSYSGEVREQSGAFTATVITQNENIALIFTFDSSESGEYAEIFNRFTQSVVVSVKD